MELLVVNDLELRAGIKAIVDGEAELRRQIVKLRAGNVARQVEADKAEP